MRLLRCFLSLAAAGASLWILPAAAASADDPAAFIQGIGDQALAVISDAQLSRPQKQAGLEKIFSANIDLPWIGRFVMGAAWRQASEDQKTRYMAEYKKFLILHYTSRFSDYSSGTFRVTGTKDDGDGDFTVSMQLLSGQPNSEPVLVEYRVHKREKEGWRIFDVIVEGVSLIATQRSEFASVIAKGGIDYLITQLAARALSDPDEAGQLKRANP